MLQRSWDLRSVRIQHWQWRECSLAEINIGGGGSGCCSFWKPVVTKLSLRNLVFRAFSVRKSPRGKAGGRRALRARREKFAKKRLKSDCGPDEPQARLAQSKTPAHAHRRAAGSLGSIENTSACPPTSRRLARLTRAFRKLNLVLNRFPTLGEIGSSPQGGRPTG